jgi:hypothetical protein
MGLIMAPPPPAPALLPPPPSNNTFNIGNSDTNRSLYDSPSWRDFSMFMAGMTPNRGRPPRGLVNMFDYDDDDDDEYIPSSLQFAQPPQAPPPGQAETVEQDIIPDNVINSIPGITEEQVAGIQNNNRIATAKREGTKHGKRGIPKQGEYREMDEYIINYEKALNTFNIENDRQKKLEEVRKNKMYELGKKHAKEGNVELAELYFRQGQKRYLKSEQEIAQQNSQQNAEIQQQSIMAKAQSDMTLEARRNAAKQKEIVLQGLFDLAKANIPVPSALNPIVNELIQNIQMPLVAENDQIEMAMAQQAEQQAQQAEQQQMQQGQMEPTQQEQQLQTV